MDFIYITAVLLLVLLFLGSHIVTSFLFKRIWSGHLLYDASFSVFFFPFFFGKGIHFQMKKEFGFDEMDFQIEYLSFWINPFRLFLGKLEIWNAHLSGFNGTYISILPSKKKIDWLPPSGRIFLKNSTLSKGELLVIDKVNLSQSRIHLKALEIYKTSFDLAYPILLLFRTKKASCLLGSGFIKSELIFPNHGFLKISGITWGEFINIGGMTLQPLAATVELHADYKHDGDISEFRGIFGKRAKLKENDLNDTSERFAFQFNVNWNHYRLPMDLGLRNLILLIFEGTVIGGVVNTALDIIRASIFSLIKKEKD